MDFKWYCLNLKKEIYVFLWENKIFLSSILVTQIRFVEINQNIQ